MVPHVLPARRGALLALGLLLPAGASSAQPAARWTAAASSPASVVLRAPRPAPRPGASPAATAPAYVDRWIAYDKAQHVLASGLLVLAGQYVLETKGGAGRRAALPLAIGASAGAGLAKESWDARRPGGSGFSKKDLVADAAGIAAAVAVILW